MAKNLGRVKDFDPNSQSCGSYKEPSISLGQMSVKKGGDSKPTPQAQRMTTGSGTRSRSMSAPMDTDKDNGKD